jgi:hypothetical protein
MRPRDDEEASCEAGRTSRTRPMAELKEGLIDARGRDGWSDDAKVRAAVYSTHTKYAATAWRPGARPRPDGGLPPEGAEESRHCFGATG